MIGMLEESGISTHPSDLEKILDRTGEFNIEGFNFEIEPLKRSLDLLGMGLQITDLPDLSDVQPGLPVILLYSHVLGHYPQELRQHYWQRLTDQLSAENVVVVKDAEDDGSETTTFYQKKGSELKKLWEEKNYAMVSNDSIPLKTVPALTAKEITANARQTEALRILTAVPEGQTITVRELADIVSKNLDADPRTTLKNLHLDILRSRKFRDEEVRKKLKIQLYDKETIKERRDRELELLKSTLKNEKRLLPTEELANILNLKIHTVRNDVALDPRLEKVYKDKYHLIATRTSIPVSSEQTSSILKKIGLSREAIVGMLSNNSTPSNNNSTSKTGGIDLSSSTIGLSTENNEKAIAFHIDPTMLKKFQNAPGFEPVIINIQPMTNLQEFLSIV